ncbi:MAG: restriction endonuclease subunit S [Veillonella sp.]|uniref:restriction endonuclease subunit S n=1 Tax=Veillonella sp. TaxID=1926307 RepID=UPI0025798F14|nr:restriction endonuclease subunit S [Veillonella sp.]MBS5756108.1 restriction endonuclease subunit S [Veillonella sp.]
MSWKKVKFGSLYKIDSRNGLTKPSKVRGEGYKMINMGELFSYDRIYDIPMELVPMKDSEKLNAKIEAGDLLFARQSLVLEGAGKCSIIMETSDLTVFESHIIRVRLKSEENPLFYYYYFKSPLSPVSTIVSQCAQAGIRGSDLSNLEVICPSRDIQDKIVDILSAYDDLIENNQKQIKLLEEATQRLYKEWFIDLRFPGHENVGIVDGVPEGWNIRPFNEVFSYVRGKSYKSSELSESEGVLLVNLKNINAFGGYKRNAEKRYLGTYKADQSLDAGDIVMGVTDMTQERRLVGHVAIVPDLGENMTFSMDLIKLIPKSVTRGYLYSAMRFGRYSEQISPFANGVNVLHLKPEAIMNMIMVVPSRDVLERYENLFESYRRKIELLEKQSNYLTEARDRLLPKLMSGEIEV